MTKETLEGSKKQGYIEQGNPDVEIIRGNKEEKHSRNQNKKEIGVTLNALTRVKNKAMTFYKILSIAKTDVSIVRPLSVKGKRTAGVAIVAVHCQGAGKKQNKSAQRRFHKSIVRVRITNRFSLTRSDYDLGSIGYS